ncbi:MAG: polyphosphate kinase 1 [Bacteroidota bacterium]
MAVDVFQNRDLSWLSFNDRVLSEAEKESVPILERIKFLSIYSSNLDEFYRVRVPSLKTTDIYKEVKHEVNRQQERFGRIIFDGILPVLEKQGVHWIYGKTIPVNLSQQVTDIFFSKVLAFLQVGPVGNTSQDFFAENNKLYQAILLQDKDGKERVDLINVPSDDVERLHVIQTDGETYIVFLEDIIKHNITYFYPNEKVTRVFNLKITRDAALNIESDYKGEYSDDLEKQLEQRDRGFASRFLAEPGVPLRLLYGMVYQMNLKHASIVEGGVYHNLKDLVDFPLSKSLRSYDPWPSISSVVVPQELTLFDVIRKQDILINVPYQSYDPVLRFFNEASGDRLTEEIYTTLYRVANNSKIVSALISAVKNGKKVVVMVELKARFDEANNIKWAKKMKNAGVKIIYSDIDLKVHAKVALVKRNHEIPYYGLMATGNLNESTAKFYTDHILLTTHQPMLAELRSMFDFLIKRKKSPNADDQIDFKHLLVAQFNLQSRFLELMQREIDNAGNGLSSGITVKLNNLEERTLIAKLYEASRAGVRVKLLIRGICCLVPGVMGMSENITVKRIVDRYLEHGRIFIFENNGAPDVYMGSADWMNRNIYDRIEVCFPIYDQKIKVLLLKLIELQLADDEQHSIYQLLKNLNP